MLLMKESVLSLKEKQQHSIGFPTFPTFKCPLSTKILL